MSAAYSAARGCAQTILWQSLRLSAFKGAVPHVLLVVDRTPCALQKILVEGYLRELNEFNQHSSLLASDAESPASLRIGLEPSAETPCYAMGLRESWKVSYGLMSFNAETFLDDVRSLQAFLRQCGEPNVGTPRWSEETIASRFDALWPLLSSGQSDGACKDSLLCSLRTGPPRELLGCILFQRNAFQNEMEKYRLRLDLFDMGLRVAEHCHLEIMSRKADSFASSGNYDACLENDEVISYMRSCSFEPHVAKSIGLAISNAIDAWSWARERKSDGSVVTVTPPAAFREAMKSSELWKVYNEGALMWNNFDMDDTDVKTDDPTLISGPGAPLRIVCHGGHTLSFNGGMEDCLLNTGFYAAADSTDRNAVESHRTRFPILNDADAKNNSIEVTSNLDEVGTSVDEKQGRLKKREYLALRKEAAALEKKSKERSNGAQKNGEQEDECVSRSGAAVGSSIGGTFPVGEVISESFDLSKLNGTCTVFAYPNNFKEVTMSEPQPLTMRIEKGIVTELSSDAPAELQELINLVRQVEGACYVRELGIGLNPFVGRQHIVSDVTAFERQFGVHLSLGQRHPLFVKQRERRNADGSVATGVCVDGPVLKRKAGRFHIDVFVDAARLEMGDFAIDFTKGLACC